MKHPNFKFLLLKSVDDWLNCFENPVQVKSLLSSWLKKPGFCKYPLI